MAKRDIMDEKYMWDLSSIYENMESFDNDYSFVINNLPKITAFSGKLKEKNNLFLCLQKIDELCMVFSKLHGFGNMKFHEDMTIISNQSIADKTESLFTKFLATTSFLEPEILSLGEKFVDEEILNNESLKVYNHFIKDIFANKDHILSKEEEKILALSMDATGAPSNIYEILQGGDLTFDHIIDQNGNVAELTHGSFVGFLRSENRDVRESAFRSYYKSIIALKNTFGTLYCSNLKNDIYLSIARNYKSSIEMYLSQNKIPVEVYKNLINTVSDSLDKMHRFIEIRKKILKLDEMHMYDIYTPLVEEIDDKLEFGDACHLVLASLEPLGKDYVNNVKKAIDEKWIDVYENDNKRSGAYSWGIYGVHPFILLNYQSRLDDAFTLAHELGHAMHSHYSSENQEYINADYPIFLAEIASTVNEALLMDHLLKTEKDPKKLKFILNYYLDSFRGTLFRQVMFAEFELKAHEMAENGSNINFASLNDLYITLNKKYYGESVISDEEIAYEWARIPHFYTPFYVFQYATGYSAAISFSRKIIAGDKDDIEKYMGFLNAGGSDYALNTLKKAGLDMTNKEPIQSALDLFEELLDKMEGLIL